MFSRLFAVAAFTALAVAGPARLFARGQCDTGAINCCQNTYQASDVHNALSQYGINVLAGVTGLVGSGCSPTSIVGVGANGASCSQEPVCCDKNAFGGLSVGCSPIGAGL